MWPCLRAGFNGGISRVRDNYSKQVAKIHPETFIEGWIACLTEFGIPEDNPAWDKAAHAPELPEPLTPYSPMILPDFDEEEYMNWPEEDEDAAYAIVASVNEAAQFTEEAHALEL